MFYNNMCDLHMIDVFVHFRAFSRCLRVVCFRLRLPSVLWVRFRCVRRLVVGILMLYYNVYDYLME